jgi:hypothetical protein
LGIWKCGHFLAERVNKRVCGEWHGRKMPRKGRGNPSRKEVHGGCVFASCYSNALETMEMRGVVTDLSLT